MYDETWPKPPLWWDDLPDVVELLGEHEANRRFAGWVLVPAGWCLRKTEPEREPKQTANGRSA